MVYEDELKTNLTLYSQLQDQKKDIEAKVDLIKQGIEKWLELNNLTECTISNTIGEEWKLSIQSRKNTKIDKDILMTMLPQEQLNKIISYSETQFLLCRKTSSKLISAAPSAPKGI